VRENIYRPGAKAIAVCVKPASMTWYGTAGASELQGHLVMVEQGLEMIDRAIINTQKAAYFEPEPICQVA